MSRAQCEAQQRKNETASQLSSLYRPCLNGQESQTGSRQSKGGVGDAQANRCVWSTTTNNIIGFVNYLSKFLPRLSDVCEPLEKLLTKDVVWHCTDHQDQAFERIQQLVTDAPVLKYYEPNEELTLQCDASQTGLGVVLTQNGQPIAFASRALSDAETRYAQIEKELLSVVFGLEKFHQYTYGQRVTVQTDHQPLESIVVRPLHVVPKRLQHLLLRLLVYDVSLTYRSGRKMQLADTLSRAYLITTQRQHPVRGRTPGSKHGSRFAAVSS